MFQVKNFVSIAASMINRMKSSTTKITDYNVGSIARTMVEAPAIEIDELYQQVWIGLKEAIPVATYNSFSFSTLPAVGAGGIVVVTITSGITDVIISAGTAFTFIGSQTTYVSAADVTIPAGNTTGNVIATATDTGALGNIASGQTFSVSPQPNRFVSATNPAAFSNGRDLETDDQRKQRFIQFVTTLSRSTVAAVEYGAKTTVLYDSSGAFSERVKFAHVDEPWILDNGQPISLINVYIHNGVGSTSAALVNQCKSVLYGYIDGSGNKVAGWKAAGVNAVVIAATEVPVNVSGLLTIQAGYSEAAVAASANSAASNYLIGLDIAASFDLAVLYKVVMSIPGVVNFNPSSLPPPAASTLTHTNGGALSATTYFVTTTYTNAIGETIESVETSHVTPSSKVLNVASPPAMTGATGWNVYVSTATGTETKQNSVPIAIGTPWVEPTSGLIAGAMPPAIPTTLLTDQVPTVSQKIMPGTMSIA